MLTLANQTQRATLSPAPSTASPAPLSRPPQLAAGGEVVSLLLALGTLEHRFAFISRDGQVEHASPAFRQTLNDPTFDGLDDEVRRFAAMLWGIANVRHLGPVVERLDCHSIHLPLGECQLQGTYVGVPLFRQRASVLVGVRITSGAVTSAERLRERFGLTPKQSRVALLLAQGLRNDEIARRLCISPHTARHHVEQIRMKVGGHTRAAVASRIR